MAATWLGRKHTDESKAKMSVSRTGKRASEETKAKMRAAKMGRRNSFFGQAHSEETKRQISENRSGKCLGNSNPLWGRWQDAEFRAKVSKTRIERGVAAGANNPNYRHGNSMKDGRRDQTTEYKKWRAAVFARDQYTCCFCGAVGGDLEADHIKPFAFFPELRVSLDNGRTLCLDCHRTTFKQVQEYRKAYYESLSVEIRSTDGN